VLQNEAKVKIQIHVEDEKEDVIVFDNPAIFLGSDFPTYIQTLAKLNRLQDLLKHTSSLTRAKFDDEKLLNFYDEIQFSYPIKLKAITSSKSGIIVMMYRTTIDATTKTIKINVIVENDTCRIYFDKLNHQAPFMGM